MVPKWLIDYLAFNQDSPGPVSIQLVYENREATVPATDRIT